MGWEKSVPPLLWRVGQLSVSLKLSTTCRRRELGNERLYLSYAFVIAFKLFGYFLMFVSLFVPTGEVSIIL